MSVDTRSGGGRPRPNFLAIASPMFAIFFGPLGIVLGLLARRQIRRSGEAGGQLATAGIALGVAVTVISVVALVLAYFSR